MKLWHVLMTDAGISTPSSIMLSPCQLSSHEMTAPPRRPCRQWSRAKPLRSVHYHTFMQWDPRERLATTFQPCSSWGTSGGSTKNGQGAQQAVAGRARMSDQPATPATCHAAEQDSSVEASAGTPHISNRKVPGPYFVEPFTCTRVSFACSCRMRVCSLRPLLSAAPARQEHLQYCQPLPLGASKRRFCCAAWPLFMFPGILR